VDSTNGFLGKQSKMEKGLAELVNKGQDQDHIIVVTG